MMHQGLRVSVGYSAACNQRFKRGEYGFQQRSRGDTGASR
jgi:hypothetical protein